MSGVSIRARTVSDGSRRFDVRYRRGGRYTPLEHAGSFRTRREANERLALVSDLLAAGLDPRVELRRRIAPRSPLRVACEGWIESRRHVSERTRESYRWREPVILEAFGEQAPAEILVEDVLAWIARLERDYAAGSVALLVGQLRMMLDFCGGPNAARDRRVRLPRRTRSQVSPPHADAVLAMLAELPARHVGTAVAMEILGTRVSETLALERRDVQAGAVRVRGEVAKSGHSRLVPAPDLLLEALMERLPLRGSRQSVANAMRRAGEINPHALRHRRASLWYQQGVGPVELARRLGHARPSMSLDVYSHVEPLEEIAPHRLASLLRKAATSSESTK